MTACLNRPVQVELAAYSQLLNVAIAYAAVLVLHYALFVGSTRWGWLTRSGSLPTYLVFPFPEVGRRPGLGVPGSSSSSSSSVWCAHRGRSRARGLESGTGGPHTR